jgi:ABC-type multidrug transport system ATPase subunit
MKTCPSCNQPTAADQPTCQRCGRPLGTPAGPGDDRETVRWSGPPVRGQAEPRKAVAVDRLFAARTQLVLGRAADCDVCLPHPTVSRHHARLERLPDGRLRLSDCSRNGVFVDGRRIEEAAVITEGARVGIGPFLFSLDHGVIHSFDSSRSLRLEAHRVEKAIALPNGVKKLLDNINLAIEPGEFVSLLGPSGSGKSTLMDCLNGRRRATGGRVLANGEDFYRHLDSFRQSLGYVPQRDIVHTQLTVVRALTYTARLRLPEDTSESELEKRVEAVIEAMELGPHRHTLIGNLSGGQVKRVSLGAELIAQPCLLYIDEATSGLDAGTEARMMRLFRKLADEGRSVICITHNVENVDRCHLSLVLNRGRVVYYGPPEEAPGYFGVGRISDIYDRLQGRAPESWEKAFQDSPYHDRYVARRLTAEQAQDLPAGETESAPASVRLPAAPAGPPGNDSLLLTPPAAVPRPHRPPLWHQLRVLTARYVELLWGDRRNFLMLLLQAPVVGVVLLLAFVNVPFRDQIPAPRRLTDDERAVFANVQNLLDQVEAGGELKPAQLALLRRVEIPTTRDQNGKPLTADKVIGVLDKLEQAKVLRTLAEAQVPVMPDQLVTNPRYSYMLLTIIVVVVFWFGCNNAAKEIVKEEAIYGRERAVNLGILPYLGSKFLVLSIISAFQVLLLMVVVYGTLALLEAAGVAESPAPEYVLAYGPQYGVMVVLATAGVATGLLISACVSNPDRANALLPYVLIPQIILAGGLIPISSGALRVLAVGLSPVYWAYRAVHRGATDILPADFPFHQEYNDSVVLACAALAVQMTVLIAATVWFLRRKDVGTA